MSNTSKTKPEDMKKGIIKLGQAIDIISGAPFKAELFNELGKGMPLIRVRDVNTGPAGVFYSGEFSEGHLVKTGDLLVSMDGDFKAVRWAYGNGLLNQRVCKIVPKDGVLNRCYLEQFLPKALSDIHRETTFTTVKHLSTKTIRDIQIPLPPLDDQKRIAHLLGKVEGLISRRKQHLQQLDDLLKSVFLEMFGDPVRNEKWWEKKPFSDLLANIDSGKSPKCEAREAADGEWGVLKLGSVTSCIFKEHENKALPREISPHTKDEVKPGDILFTRKNTYELVAACAYVFETRPRLLLPDLIFRFVLKEDAGIIPIFLWKLLISHSQRKKIQALAGGAAGSMPNISKANLKQVLLPVPPINLQIQFSAIVEKVEGLKSRYQKSLIDLESLYGALSQKAFKGELDLSRVPLPVEATSEDTDSTEEISRETREKHEMEQA